ncbi:oligosaccharide flippase family protein [Altericista sp. CCNU0014]|uniref:oligosaccharide flippase family protein n=1 Tax=Altericista sp. CCNU0014 TaxID=3082949 RepID=UPI0038502BC6
MASLKSLAVRGTVWTLIGYGSSQGLRFASNLILTRLLLPDLFGLMALLNTFIMGLHFFSDLGVRPSIIQNPRGDDPAFLNTAWTLQIIRGVGLWVCCLAITWPLAAIYRNPDFLWLIPVTGLTTIFDGLISTSLSSLSRSLNVGKITRFEFIIQLVSTLIMLVWAYLSPTIWALVGSTLVSTVLKMLWSHRLGYINRLAWDKDALEDLINFGRWVFLSTAMTFLAGQADRLILGRLFPLELLGIYTIAFTLSDLPLSVIQAVGSNVILPVISQQNHLPRSELRRKILEKRNLLLVGTAVGLTGLICFGDFLILGLYPPTFERAAWMLPILALGNWPRILPMTTAPALIAVGTPLYGAVGNCLKFAYMLVALPLGFAVLGPLGAVIAIALNDVPFYLAVSYGLWKEGFSGLMQDLKTTCLLIVCVAITLAIRYWVGLGLPLDRLWS